MESLIKLFYDWEIQLLVLLSFAIQIFLFFSGGLRRCSTNMFLRLSIWIFYLAADMVAFYALGYLSRHDDATTGCDTLRGTHPLAFFWAPFLLIHLGGQDTITAFALEDNNLWLRHLLNLVVQAVLAVYVFWKSIGRHNVKLIVSGSFVFVAGIIKYGERTWSLRSGSYKNLETVCTAENPYKFRQFDVDVSYPGYSEAVCTALRSMGKVLRFFVQYPPGDRKNVIKGIILDDYGSRDMNKMLKMSDIELGMMYDDLYTKALVLRTRSGIILRCISQISMVVAFILFHAYEKRNYIIADIAITYSLFIGGFFLELCAVFIIMMSPWTWAWLEAREYYRLARCSWFLLCNAPIGWPEKKPLWSNAMGQYNFSGSLDAMGQYKFSGSLDAMGQYNFSGSLEGSDVQSKSCGQRVMNMARKLATSVGVEKENILWISKILYTEYVKADKTMECLFSDIPSLLPEVLQRLGFKEALSIFGNDFGSLITLMHMHTERHLSKYSCSEEDINGLVEECRKLSRYMMYLLVTHPSLLPLSTSAGATLKVWSDPSSADQMDLAYYLKSLTTLPGKEALEELKEVWIRLIIYAASMSRPEIHAALLARGGEPLTFVWLHLAQLGWTPDKRGTIELINGTSSDYGARRRYMFAL